MLMSTVERYLAVRRSVGFKLDSVGKNLKRFALFAVHRGESHVVATTAIEWASQARSERARHDRLNQVILFARFMRAEDDRHEVPPDGVFCGIKRRPTPYIFTEEETKKLVVEADRLSPPGPLRAETYSTLFGLLVVTGLRISEALKLRIGDLTDDGLVIRDGKFRKGRLVPLHETASVALRRYLAKRRKIAGDDDHLFVSRRRGRLRISIVTTTFHNVLKAAGIPADSNQRRPRLMDLRHTFAVRALEKCPDGCERVGRHMLALSTYMGHARVEDTYWYLESTPELLSDIAMAAEALVHGGTP